MERKIISRLFSAVIFALLLFLSGCVNPNKMEITSFKVKQVSPAGLRSVSLMADLGLVNNSSAFRVYDIEGVINRSGKEFGTFAVEPLSVGRKSSGLYELKCTASLCPSVPLFELMSLLSSDALDEFTVSLSCKVKPKGGVVKKFKFKDVPASVLLDRLKDRQL